MDRILKGFDLSVACQFSNDRFTRDNGFSEIFWNEVCRDKKNFFRSSDRTMWCYNSDQYSEFSFRDEHYEDFSSWKEMCCDKTINSYLDLNDWKKLLEEATKYEFEWVAICGISIYFYRGEKPHFNMDTVEYNLRSIDDHLRLL